MALTLAALPLSQAHAQNAPPDPATAAVDATRAAALRAQAGAMFADRTRYDQAADLLVQAAALTPVEDAARVDDLRLAANLVYFTGAVSRAQVLMVRAANAALDRGDIAGASNTLIDASWLATERHATSQARELAVRALRLSDSPQLGAAARDAIRKRIVLKGLGGISASADKAQVRTGWSVASQQSTWVHG